MKLSFVFALTVLAHTAFTGSRITAALHALHLQASPLAVGVLMSLYALLPMVFGVAAGRLIDRVGAARPMLWSSATLVAGLMLPFAWPSLAALYVAATVIGTAFMVYHVALNNVVGALGAPADRPRNFAWLALGFSTGGFCGPLLAGFSIDGAGYGFAFLLLAVFPSMAFLGLVWKRHDLPSRETTHAHAVERNVMDLLREPRLRAAFLASGLLATGWDLYTFVIPIYGSRIGLSASTIGIVMGSFAAATFAVRVAMPALVRHVREWPLIAAALGIAGFAYSLFPFVSSVPLLMALSFVLGAGLGCSQPMIMALLYAASPAGREGEVVGVRTTLLNLSHTVLPLVFGAVGSALGMGPVFWTMSACLLSGLWFAARRVK